MFVDPHRHGRVLVAVAVAMVLQTAYGAFIRHRQHEQLDAATRQQLGGIGLLEQRLKQQSDSHPTTQIGFAEQAMPPLNAKDALPNPTHQSPTVVEAFADVLDLVDSNDVTCVSATPEYPDANLPTLNSASYRLSLEGSFHSVQTIVKVIETTLPNLAVTELTMTRTSTSMPCQWELVVGFSEVVP